MADAATSPGQSCRRQQGKNDKCGDHQQLENHHHILSAGGRADSDRMHYRGRQHRTDRDRSPPRQGVFEHDRRQVLLKTNRGNRDRSGKSRQQ